MDGFELDLFVNRKKAIQLFLDTLQGKTLKRHLEFNGVAGQGKTEFLKWICHNPLQQPYLPAYVDFELSCYKRRLNFPILGTLVEQLSGKVSPNPFSGFQASFPAVEQEYLQARQDSWPEPFDLKDFSGEERLIVSFNKSFGRLLDSHKIVFCLDSVEKADSETFRAFEKQVLTSHIGHDNFLLVAAGQRRNVWESRRLRKQLQREALPDLKPEYIYEQVQKLAGKHDFFIDDDDTLWDFIQGLTMGHPFSNYKLIQQWTDGFKTAVHADIIKDQKRINLSVKGLVDEVIHQRILESFPLEEEQDVSTNEILWYLAPLRNMEVSACQYLLSSFLLPKDFMSTERLLRRFQEAHLVSDWQLGREYTMKPVVRNLFLYDMRLKARERFQQIQKSLIAYYEKAMSRTHDISQIHAIMEYLYHSAVLFKDTQPNDDTAFWFLQTLGKILNKCFRDKLDRSNGETRGQLYYLYHALENDQDLNGMIDLEAPLEMLSDRFRMMDGHDEVEKR